MTCILGRTYHIHTRLCGNDLPVTPLRWPSKLRDEHVCGSICKYIDTYDRHWYLVLLLTNFAPHVLLHMLSRERTNVEGSSGNHCLLPGLVEMFKNLIILQSDAIFKSKELYLKDPQGFILVFKKI